MTNPTGTTPNNVLSPWQIDNRWSPGVAATAPADSPAAYSARWIDEGTRASIVPDRQGFAYSTDIERSRLINLLQDAGLHRRTAALDYDTPTMMYGTPGDVWTAWLVRRGGYVYVEAWTKPEVVVPQDWWRDHDALVTLTAWMADRGLDGKSIAHAVEKPWHYEDEYRQALAWAAE